LGKEGKEREMLLFFFLLLCAESAGGVVLPSRQTGQYALETYHTVDVKVGTPGRLMTLRLDFNSALLVTKIPLQVVSRSYSPFGGGSDVVHFGGRDYRVLVKHDGGAMAAALGCPSCDGVLGLGSGSRVWLYSEETVFTAGAQLLDEELLAFTRGLGDDRGRVICLPGFTNLCTASATVRNHPVVVFFGLPASKTIVPKPVFEDYTLGLSITRNDAEDFGDLDFTFPVVPGTGKSNGFTLRRQDLVSKSRRGGLDLLLQSGGVDNTTVVLSQSSWRSLLMKKNHQTGTMQITSWSVNKHWSVHALLTLLVESVLFLYWILTPSGAWEMSYKPMWKIGAEAAGAILAVVTYALPATQTALQGHVEVNIFVGAMLVNQILWQIYAGLVSLGVAADFFGDLTLPFLGKGNGKERRKRRRMHPRVYLAMNMANQTILLILAWLLVIETRVETLGGFFSLLFVLILLGNLVYHLLLVGYVPTGDKRTFVWVLYWINALVIVLVGVIVVEIHVLAPFVERFIPMAARFIPLVSVVVYAALILLASSAAKLRSQFELFMRQTMVSKRGKNK
jgi:hypothetical protein